MNHVNPWQSRLEQSLQSLNYSVITCRRPGSKQQRINHRVKPSYSTTAESTESQLQGGSTKESEPLHPPSPHWEGVVEQRSPSWVQAPSRLMMFLCRPIIFIISISEARSHRSLSVPSAVRSPETFRYYMNTSMIFDTEIYEHTLWWLNG